jgi:hypothetical protein
MRDLRTDRTASIVIRTRPRVHQSLRRSPLRWKRWNEARAHVRQPRRKAHLLRSIAASLMAAGMPIEQVADSAARPPHAPRALPVRIGPKAEERPSNPVVDDVYELVIEVAAGHPTVAEIAGRLRQPAT